MEHKLQDREISPIKRRGNNWGKKIMTHSMDLHNKPEQLVARRPKRMKTEVEEISKWSVDIHSKPVTPEEKSRKNDLNKRETLFVAFDLESTGEMPSFFLR